MNVAAPAIVDAIHDAVGVWVTELPATRSGCSRPWRSRHDHGASTGPGIDGQLSLQAQWRAARSRRCPACVDCSTSFARTSASTGTKEGCGEGECGACSVILDGRVVDSCLVPVCQVEGSEVHTVEGLSDSETEALSPLQQAFLEAGGAQCGICTPGMLMAAQAYLDDGGGA